MSRFGKILAVAMLLVPAVAHAQRPGNTMQTRSAELYLDRAERNQYPEEKAKLYQQAVELALEGVQKDPDNSKTWFTLGKVYASQGHAAGADSAFDQAEKMWPEYVEETEDERLKAYITSFNAGITAIQQNKLQEAIASLEAAHAVYPKKPTAALNLGNLYAKANDADKAAAAYRTALEVLRGPGRAELNEAEQKQWAEWEDAAAFNLAQILATAQKDEEAAQAYVDYLARNPDNVVARSNLAVVYSRMGKTEEATRTYNELLAQDLTDDEFFQVGVGLFRGEQHERAAEAFRKALAKNPAFRDAYYNLAQSIYSVASALEDARAQARPAEVKAIDARLKPLYEELQAAAEKARELDPNNRNVLALLARAYRGMADVVDAKAAAEWKNKTLKVMEAHRDLPIEVMDVQITNEGGTVKLTGNLVNLKATEGQPVKVVISFLGKDGAVLGTQEVTVTAPTVEEQVAFAAELKTDKPLGGWKYEIL
ncbi:MAG: tetratricopeptide repeat protein [Gemmatimonadota bacterium]